jgi:hypothetical protein
MIPHGIAERVGELLHAHRLLNRLMTLPLRRKPADAQAGREQERHAALGQDIGNREDQLAGEMHVEYRDIDALMASSQIGRAPDIASRTDDFTAELGKHVLEQQAYHHVILDQEDVEAFEYIGRGHVGACRVDPSEPYTSRDHSRYHRLRSPGPGARRRGTKRRPRG